MKKRLRISGLFDMRREDGALVWLLFFYHLLMTAATVVGRTVGDTLFLSRFGAANLSYMYLAVAVAVSLTGVIYHRVVNRFSKQGLMYSVSALIAVLVVGMRFAAGYGFDFLFSAIYIAFELFNALLIWQFWTFTNDLMDARQARRMLGLIGAAGIIGGMAGGFALRFVVHFIGTLDLMFVYVGLICVCVLIVIALSRKTGVQTERNVRARAEHSADKRQPPLSYHLRLVAVIMAMIAMALIFIDFQFKAELQQHFKNEDLAAFLGNFYGIAGAIALVLQLFVTNRILARFGILASLLILPVYLALGSAAVLFLPGLLTVVFAKAGDKLIADTLFASTGQLMYVPMAPEIRGRAKVFVDGIVKPVAKGLAAVILIGIAPFLPPRAISVVVLVLLAVCIVAMVLVKREYVKALFSTLRTSRLDFSEAEAEVSDASAIDVLVKGLSSNDSKQVLYCFESLKALDGLDILPYAVSLLDHSSEAVRIEALKTLEVSHPASARRKIASLLNSGSSQLRRQAVLTVAAYADEETIRILVPLLSSEDVTLRGAAAGALMKHYGIDGIFHTVDSFKSMLESKNEAERMEAARVLGYVGVAHFYQPLIRLLDDPSPAVQLEAIESTRAVGVAALIPHIIHKLRRRATRFQAIGALSSYRAEDVIPAIRGYLSADERSDEIAVYVPRVCELVATKESVETLMQAYRRSSPYLRGKILVSLTAMRVRDPELKPNELEIKDLLLLECAEMADCTRVLSGIAILSGQNDTQVLFEAVEDLRKDAQSRMFRLLAFLYQPRVIAAVERNLGDAEPRRRANAIEVLDNLLQEPLRRAVLAELNRVEKSRQPIVVSNAVLLESLRAALFWDDDWVRRTVMYLIKQGSLDNVAGDETARIWDEASARVFDHYPGENADLVRTVLTLRKVDIFAGLPGNYLVTIAAQLGSINMKKAEVVFNEGDPGDSFFVLVGGKLSVLTGGAFVANLNPGDCFGEMAILDQERRSATVVCDEDSLLFKLDSSTFYDIIAERIEIAKGVIRMLCARWRQRLASLDSGAAPAQGVRAEGLDLGDLGTELTSDSLKRQESNPVQGPASDAETTDLDELDEIEELESDDDFEDDDAVAIVPAALVPQTPPADELHHHDSTLLKRALLLKGIALFSGLSREDLFLLAAVVEERFYRRGETIVHEGDGGDAVFGISEGLVSVRRGGRELEQMTSGAYFGEMALLDGEPRSASVVALRDTALLRLSQDDFYALLSDKIEITRPIFAELIYRIRRFSREPATAQ